MTMDDYGTLFVLLLVVIGLCVFGFGPPLLRRAGFNVRDLDGEEVGMYIILGIMALGAVRAVRERGLAVPDDVSVVGYDDIPLASYTDPPLTPLRQPVRAISAAAAAALFRQMETGAPMQHGEYLFQVELLVRGSTGPVGARAGAGTG
jgi:hypothetical protein